MDMQSFSPTEMVGLAAAVTCAALFLKNLSQCLYKLKLYIQGFIFMALCKDKKWKKPDDPSDFSAAFAPGKTKKKTFVFVRHGESTWNDVFNKGQRPLGTFVLGYLPTMAKSLAHEAYLFFVGAPDSLFYDSPLSIEGMEQVARLKQFLSVPAAAGGREAELVALLRGDEGAPSSVLLSSNLRRAISTVACAFSDRIARRGDKMILHHDLQEISRNIDALSITPPRLPAVASYLEVASDICNFVEIYEKHVDVSINAGNKSMDSNGLKRMSAFNDYAFTVEEEALIIGGHSLWFREFFRTFLPYSAEHVSKKKKLVNAGAVSFTLLQGKKDDGAPVYMIDPKSIEVIYGGF